MTNDVLVERGMTFTNDGAVLLSGSAAELFCAWEGYLRATLLPYYTTSFESPAFISQSLLHATGYDEHFPQHVIHGCGHGGGRDLPMTPASCFHVYPQIGLERVDGYSALVTGPCSRYEDGSWDPPFRLSCFHMTELVVVGPQAYVARVKREVRARIEKMFAALELPGAFETAVDAFYLGNGRGARLIQEMKELKKEFRMPLPVGSAAPGSLPPLGASAASGSVPLPAGSSAAASGTVALASVNDHEDYFGRCFDLRGADGAHAHSLCAAFGLERLTAAGLLVWGATPDAWPSALRSQAANTANTAVAS